MNFDYDNSFIKDNIFKGEFGLEMESLRVDKNGFLSHTKHPFNGNIHIDRDFCENQIEMITKVCYSVDSLHNEIKKLRNTVIDKLKTLESGQEFLWSFSNPPYVRGESDIPIAKFDKDLKEKEIYREYLSEKYGKRKMLFSGIHLNFSFPKEIIDAGYKESNDGSYKEYKSRIYLELAKKLTAYSWLIVYLTASSPVTDGSFFKDEDIGKDIPPEYSSYRCSEIGYWNDFIPILKYDSLKEYTESIQKYLDNGKLKSASELYYPIRLKPLGENSLKNLEESGVNHIELRMLDLNPLSSAGIMKEDINFIHILIIYLMSLEDKDLKAEKQINAIKNIKQASIYDDKKIFIQTNETKAIPIKEAVLQILNDMENFFAKHYNPNVFAIIEYQRKKIIFPQNRYAEIIKNNYGTNYVKKGLELAKKYAKEF